MCDSVPCMRGMFTGVLVCSQVHCVCCGVPVVPGIPLRGYPSCVGCPAWCCPCLSLVGARVYHVCSLCALCSWVHVFSVYLGSSVGVRSDAHPSVCMGWFAWGFHLWWWLAFSLAVGVLLGWVPHPPTTMLPAWFCSSLILRRPCSHLVVPMFPMCSLLT